MVNRVKLPPAFIAAQALSRTRHRRAPPSGAAAHVVPVYRGGRLVRFEWRGRPIKQADPVSIGIAVLTAASSISGVALGFEAAFAIGTAVIIGGGIAASMLLGTGGSDGAGEIPNYGGFLNSQEVRINRRQPTPHKKIIYGTTLTGGDMFFERAGAPYLYHGWMISSREIEGFVQARIGTDILAILSTDDVLPMNQILTPQGNLIDGLITATPDYATNLRLSLRQGLSTQVIDPLLDAAFTALESDFRQRGIATAVLRYQWPGSTYDSRQAMWGDAQAPNPLFMVKGSKIYDPRDPTQDQDTESTWQWSENAALCQTDYLRQPYGGRVDSDDIDWDKVRLAADYDDELVGTTTAGEYIKRHTFGGVITLNQSPSDVIPGMLTANRGFVCEQAGVFWVTSSRPKTPILTIHDGMLTGGIEFQGAKPKRDLVNRVLSRFIASEREYQQVDGPILDRTDLQAIDGETLTATLNLPFTPDHRRVQRLQKAYLETARLGKVLTLRISLGGFADSAEELLNEIVTFDSDLFSPANGQYRVNVVGLADNYASVELQLTEYDADIERDWTPADDEQAFEIADLDLS